VQAVYPTSGDAVPSHTGVIRVYVRELNQLFDSMDPSPFHEKGLDRDAEEYIVACAKEFQNAGPAALVVQLEKPPGPPDEARTLADAIRRHFVRRAGLLRWELRQLLRRGTTSLVIGLVALAVALAAGEWVSRALGPGHLAQVLGTTLHIGGWVAMWTPMQIFLYEWWPILGDIRLYERLGKMPVQIVYTGQAPVREGPAGNGHVAAGRFGGV
jgi:hypothetical protein